MLTPVSAPMVPSAPLPSASGVDRLVRLESKFPLAGAELAIRLLEIHWRPDPAFPSNQVFTIHFDTQFAAWDNHLPDSPRHGCSLSDLGSHE